MNEGNLRFIILYRDNCYDHDILQKAFTKANQLSMFKHILFKCKWIRFRHDLFLDIRCKEENTEHLKQLLNSLNIEICVYQYTDKATELFSKYNMYIHSKIGIMNYNTYNFVTDTYYQQFWTELKSNLIYRKA